MAKTKVYLRVAKTNRGFRFSAHNKPSNQPLNSGAYNTEWYPTISFALDLNIPDSLFAKASTAIAEINLNAKNAVINAEILTPEPKES